MPPLVCWLKACGVQTNQQASKRRKDKKDKGKNDGVKALLDLLQGKKKKKKKKKRDRKSDRDQDMDLLGGSESSRIQTIQADQTPVVPQELRKLKQIKEAPASRLQRRGQRAELRTSSTSQSSQRTGLGHGHVGQTCPGPAGQGRLVGNRRSFCRDHFEGEDFHVLRPSHKTVLYPASNAVICLR